MVEAPSNRDQLVAFQWTLVALVVVFISALIAAIIAPDILGRMEAFSLGTITGGLIGVLRSPQSRNVTVDQPPSAPIPTQDVGDAK